MRSTALLAAALGTAVLAAGATPPAEAAPAAKSYLNCTALNKVYPHGVGKAKAKDKVTGRAKPVTTFTRSDAVYARNDGGTKRYAGERDLDRDNDGVACEKR